MLKVRVLGDLALEVDGVPRPLPQRRPGRLLLGWLALHPGAHARGDVAAALWPDVRADSARGSLRSALLAARRALGERHADYLVGDRATIGLRDDDAVWIDAAAFDAGDPEQAIALYRGPILQGLDEEWVQRAREDYGDRLGEALAAAARDAEAGGDLGSAVDLTRRQLALDDLSEPVARELIRRLRAAGDRQAALEAYRRLAARLRDQLRLAPSLETRRLLAAVRGGAAPPVPAQRPLPPAAGRALATPIAGRHAELAALDDGAHRVILVGGEAGIGKTRLLAELAARAHGRGAQVLWGQCLAEPDRPYAAIVEALGEDMPIESAGGNAERLYADVGAALRALSAERALLLVIDDLHWADPSTVRLLDELVRAQHAPALTLAVAHRPPCDQLGLTLQRWRRRPDAAACELAGLDPGAVAELLARLAGRTPAAGVADAVATRTAGHPLFVTELARRFDAAWPTAQAISATALPDRVADVVGERVAALGPPARRALGVAAVLGENFSFGQLAAIVGDEEAALDALDEAVAADLVREERAGRYRFVHAVVHETAYRALTQTRRAHLHRRVAATLERLEDPPLRPLAMHHLAAVGLGDPLKAVEYAARAAAEAAEQAAHEDSAALYERALRALPDTGPAARRRCELQLALGSARRRAGDGVRVREAFLAAAAQARELRDAELLGEAALGVCSVPWFPGSEAADGTATGLLESALDLAGEHPSPLTVRLRAQLVRERYFVAGARATLTQGERVVEAARATGDDEALALALDVWSVALVGQADAPTRRAAAAEMLGVARRAGLDEAQLRALVWAALAGLQAGDSAPVQEAEEALEHAAARRHEPSWSWWPALWRSMRALAAGDLEAGEELVLAAWRIGERPFGERAALEMQAQLAWIRWRQRRLDELDQLTAATGERYAAIPAWRCVRALVDAELGRTEAARKELGRLRADRFASLADANRLVSLALVAETCTLTGDVATAQPLRAALAAHAGEWPVSGYGGLVLGPVDETLRGLDALVA